jgi:predicted transcriptional regulator
MYEAGIHQAEIARRLGCTKETVRYHTQPRVREAHLARSLQKLRDLSTDPFYREARAVKRRERYKSDPVFRERLKLSAKRAYYKKKERDNGKG